MSSEETQKLAKRYVEHITNESGEVLANVYES